MVSDGDGNREILVSSKVVKPAQRLRIWGRTFPDFVTPSYIVFTKKTTPEENQPFSHFTRLNLDPYSEYWCVVGQYVS